MAFGTISPITMCPIVSSASASTLASTRGARQRSDAAEPMLEELRERVLAVHAEAEARERDAELRRGDVLVLPLRRRQHAEHPRREPVAARRASLERGLGRPDQRELRRHEQRVHQDEQQAQRAGRPRGRHGVRARPWSRPSKLAEHVLNRDQPDSAPGCVGDDRGVDAPFAQLRDRAIGRQALGHVTTGRSSRSSRTGPSAT